MTLKQNKLIILSMIIYSDEYNGCTNGCFKRLAWGDRWEQLLKESSEPVKTELLYFKRDVLYILPCILKATLSKDLHSLRRYQTEFECFMTLSYQTIFTAGTPLWKTAKKPSKPGKDFMKILCVLPGNSGVSFW